mmetsp:Transcript_40500/g.52152  ORF Transcript_40500/g.52152 Transcript_40500/m.52152 type:complete len:230 (+) Transcript_40500:182-871(+)
MGEDEGTIMCDAKEIEALTTISKWIKSKRKFPFSGSNPISYWEGCCISVKPNSGYLMELIIKNCSLEIDLEEFAPTLIHMKALEWLDISENPGINGSLNLIIDLAPNLYETLDGLDIHDTNINGNMICLQKLLKLSWLNVACTQIDDELDCLVPLTDSGILRFIDVSYCANLRGCLPARFERASKLTVKFESTELQPEDLIGQGKTMPGGYYPPSHPLFRLKEETLAVW